MATADTGSILRLGRPEEISDPGLVGITHELEPRGLVIKEITLNRDAEGPFDDDAEVYFISTAMDFSGEAPLVFPLGRAEDAVMHLEPGDTFRFTLGEGAPVFPMKLIVDGLVVQVHIFESDSGVQGAGEALQKAADAVKTDGNLLKLLEQLIKNPGGVATKVVLGAAAELATVVSTILSSNDNDNVAFFTGYWSAQGSWAGQLHADQRGASILFGELPSSE
jgi:hypothetical protein